MALIVDFDEIRHLKISQAVIALGSNFEAEHNVTHFRQDVLAIAAVHFSEVQISADITGRTSFLYHNACALLQLHRLSSLEWLDKWVRQIECDYGRNRQDRRVPLDIDVLAVFADQWYVNQRRLPFKPYEKSGVGQVAPFLL